MEFTPPKGHPAVCFGGSFDFFQNMLLIKHPAASAYSLICRRIQANIARRLAGQMARSSSSEKNGLPALALEPRIARQHQRGIVARRHHEVAMHGGLRDAETRQAALSRAEHIALAAQAQILLGDT